MIDFDNLDKVSNIICKINSTLTIKHVIELRDRSSNRKDANVRNYAYYYSFPSSQKYAGMSKAPKNNSGLMFHDEGHIVIENRKNVVRGSQVQVEKILVSIYLTDAPQLLNAFNVVTSWLTTESDNIYVPDPNGHPTKISDPLIRMQCPIKGEATGLVFKPCIITDNVGVKYQGVAMGNHEKGEICNFTASEFVTFKNMITYVLNNLYATNMLLTTQTIQYCTYKNFMEVVQRNAGTHKPK